MPSIKFTDRYVASATVPTGERLDVFDKLTAGLMLRISGTGRKTFYFRYRTLAGQQPRYKLGAYPALKLADARNAAIRLAGQVTLGVNPAGERRKARDEGKSETIGTFDELGSGLID